jgi:hypothetical protein
MDYNAFTDWKFWTFVLGCLNFIGVILLGCFNYFANLKLTNNDLQHISTDVKDIKEEQKCMKIKITELSEDVGYLKGKVEL